MTAIPTAHSTSKHFKTKETAELQSTNSDDSDSRFDATDSAVRIYRADTPGQSATTKTVKKIVKEAIVRDAAGHEHALANVSIRMANRKIKSMPPGKSGSSGGGGE